MDSDSIHKLFISRSLNQANKLNTLVEDLLNMSRHEAGKREFHLEVFDVRQLLIVITETFSYSNQSHVIKFDVGSEPIKVRGDKHRIEQNKSSLIITRNRKKILIHN